MERLAWAEGCLPVVKWSRRWRAVMWTRNKQRSVVLLSVFTLIVITRKEPSDS